MPGMYSEDDFDLAGFAVGIAERSEMDTDSNVRPGQVLIALPSSGIHSNGFSLVRKLLFEKLEMKFDDEFDGKPLIDTLLEPTRIYVKAFKSNKSRIKALAHITGGGIVENLPRVLPEGIKAIVTKADIRILPIFELMGAHVEEDEMFRAFNMGVGMVWVVEEENVEAVLADTDGYVIGKLEEGTRGVEFV
jgi:phosphoribosylformylglycinamidine cyclo-ligase